MSKLDDDQRRLALVTLPSDVTAESSRGFYTLSIVRVGGVTIDVYKRGFRAGWSYFGRLVSTERYEGRGWCDRIVADAIAYLRKFA